jgi:argininosuccinate lyase
MKLWSDKGKTSEKVEEFTAGQDAVLDLQLAEYDILGTVAHIRMLEKVGLLTTEELDRLIKKLRVYYGEATEGRFVIEPGVEDVHSQVELRLTSELGEIGMKIHTARSRNDQVLLDIRLFFREEIRQITALMGQLFQTLMEKAEKNQHVLMPGYTHLQVGMVSSASLWLSAYAETLADDLRLLSTVFLIVNQNPLGSGAGYGSSMPIDRLMTTELLGFDGLNVNSVHAQLSRGKTEWFLGTALASVADTVGRLAMDICLYAGQNFQFISLPDEFTTGSSIMPHKRNPDVFELIRARCNQVRVLPGQIGAITGNLPSGYHRDFQQLKEIVFPAIHVIQQCLEMMRLGIRKMAVNEGIIEDPIYDHLFTVEKVNELVREGMPFRKAYRQVADEVSAGKFKPDRRIHHTHIGSIGNPGFDLIRKKWVAIYQSFDFAGMDAALEQLWDTD